MTSGCTEFREIAWDAMVYRLGWRRFVTVSEAFRGWTEWTRGRLDAALMPCGVRRRCGPTRERRRALPPSRITWTPPAGSPMR